MAVNPVDKVFDFDTSIYKNSGGGYKIWIPKVVMEQISSDTWFVSECRIISDDFKQILKNHPLSKGGTKQGYIPIYCEEVMADYTQFGRVAIHLILG